MEKEKIDLFRRTVNESCTLSEEEMAEKVVIDMEMPFSAVTGKLVEEASFLLLIICSTV